MEITLEHIAEEVWTLKGAYNGISSEIKDLKTEVHELRQEIRELYKKTERDKTELIERIAETETKITGTKAEIIKWMFIFWMGQVAVVAALLAYFFKFH